MIVAVPIYQGRVSPLFDVAQAIVVFLVHQGRVCSRQQIPVVGIQPSSRARQVLGAEADVLICGAISRSLHVWLTSQQVEVIPNICGAVDDIVTAWLAGRLDSHRLPRSPVTPTEVIHDEP